MDVVVIVLAVVGVLFALGASIANVAKVRVPALAVGAALLLPLALGVATARSAIDTVVTESFATHGVYGWMTGAAGVAATAWSGTVWAAWILVFGAPLPLLLAAVAGALRGPRRWWLFGIGLGWTAVVLGAVMLALVSAGRDLTPLALLLAPAVALFGVLTSVAFLAGGERRGPSAAGIAGLVAATGLVALGVGVGLHGQVMVARAVATAPVELQMTLWAGGQSLEGASRIASFIAAFGGVGFAAIGLGAGDRLGGAVGTAGAALLLPLLVLGADPSALVGAGIAAAGAVPAAQPTDDVWLPIYAGTGATHRAGPGQPGVQLTPEGVRWLEPGKSPELVQGPLTAGIVTGRWPAERPPPILFVDRRVPAEAAAQTISALVAQRQDPVRLAVDASEDARWRDIRFITPSLIEPVAPGPQALYADPALAEAAGCVAGACPSVAQALKALGRPTRGEVVVAHPDAPMGLVVRLLDHAGVDRAQLSFEPRSALTPEAPEAPE